MCRVLSSYFCSITMAGINFRVSYFSIIFLLLLLRIGLKSQLAEGDKCFNNRYRIEGACQKLEHCKKVLDDFLEEDLTPQLCQYSKDESIVCCPGVKAAKKEIVRPKYRDSRFMCAEYAKTVFKLIDSPVIGGPPLNVSLCAHRVSPLIIGGEPAKAGEFPHMALIGYDYKANNSNKIERKWGCGGSLISEIWVLTAAHCTEDVELGYAKYVRLGELDFDRNDDETKIQDFTVAEIKKYPTYTYFKYDDIALLKLNVPAKFTKFVRPACLWTKPDIPTKRAIATGWGTINDYKPAMNSYLLKVIVDLASKEQCDKFYKPSRALNKGLNYTIQLCSGGVGKDTCKGDSGGPLQIFADEDFYCMYYVVGVTSFGHICGDLAPGVYARVASYIRWIEEIVWNNADDVL